MSHCNPPRGVGACANCRHESTKQLKRERYHQNKAGGRCVVCRRENSNGKRTCDTCNVLQINAAKNQRKALRLQVRQHYGMTCSCCGEHRQSMLCLDHINGGGNQHRKSEGIVGMDIYRWVVANNFPPIFQTLCASCNQSKMMLGVCEHSANKDESNAEE